MQFEVLITPSAKADIFEINAWLLENHPDGAKSGYMESAKPLTSLSKFPERCVVSPESEAFDVTVRQLIYGKNPHTYRILFSIQDEKVYILRIRSTHRQGLSEE